MHSDIQDLLHRLRGEASKFPAGPMRLESGESLNNLLTEAAAALEGLHTSRDHAIARVSELLGERSKLEAHLDAMWGALGWTPLVGETWAVTETDLVRSQAKKAISALVAAERTPHLDDLRRAWSNIMGPEQPLTADRLTTALRDGREAVDRATKLLAEVDHLTGTVRKHEAERSAALKVLAPNGPHGAADLVKHAQRVAGSLREREDRLGQAIKDREEARAKVSSLIADLKMVEAERSKCSPLTITMGAGSTVYVTGGAEPPLVFAKGERATPPAKVAPAISDAVASAIAETALPDGYQLELLSTDLGQRLYAWSRPTRKCDGPQSELGQAIRYAWEDWMEAEIEGVKKVAAGIPADEVRGLLPQQLRSIEAGRPDYIPDDKLVEALGMYIRDLEADEDAWRGMAGRVLGVNPLHMTDEDLREHLESLVNALRAFYEVYERWTWFTAVREFKVDVKTVEAQTKRLPSDLKDLAWHRDFWYRTVRLDSLNVGVELDNRQRFVISSVMVGDSWTPEKRESALVHGLKSEYERHVTFMNGVRTGLGLPLVDQDLAGTALVDAEAETLDAASIVGSKLAGCESACAKMREEIAALRAETRNIRP